MYRYETHLHTLPVSKCAKASVLDNLKAYAALGFTGVFITNHFIDGNIDIDRSLPYEQRIEFYFSDYEEAKRLNPSWDGKSTTIKVWTDTLRMNHERWLELLDEELDIIERYMGPYVESVLNQRFEALNALCKKEPVDIYCAVNGILNVGFHAYYVELTADAINTLTERGGYVFRLALFNQTDYGYWNIDE